MKSASENKRVIYKNFIQKKYLNKKIEKKLNKNYFSVIENILKNSNFQQDELYSLTKHFKYSFNFRDLKKFNKFKTIVIIGMGGSILGSEAIYFFLKDKIKKNFLFFNDINEYKIEKLKKKNNLNKILFIVISKSGKTIETLSNLLALKIIKKNSKNILLISEKNKNPLYLLSKKFSLHHIPHKKYIGGRYSVFSEAGVIPAYFMGININKLRMNILSHFKGGRRLHLKDSSMKISNLFINKKFKNLIFFNYVSRLDKFLYWAQQLIAESLGKNKKGFLPLVSKAPKDHHSLLQFYLDGPKDQLFYIFSAEEGSKLKIKANPLGKELHYLNNKSLSDIKIAQKNSFISELKRKNIPFREFKIKDFSEQTLGELFSCFILETVIVGKLSKINPFDQPAVERIKINTKKILS